MHLKAVFLAHCMAVLTPSAFLPSSSFYMGEDIVMPGNEPGELFLV